MDLKAVEVVPWGPHFGPHIIFKTNIHNMAVPEIVRPRPLEDAVKELEKLGLAEPSEDETPRITWAGARKFTILKRKQP